MLSQHPAIEACLLELQARGELKVTQVATDTEGLVSAEDVVRDTTAATGAPCAALLPSLSCLHPPYSL